MEKLTIHETVSSNLKCQNPNNKWKQSSWNFPKLINHLFRYRPATRRLRRRLLVFDIHQTSCLNCLSLFCSRLCIVPGGDIYQVFIEYERGVEEFSSNYSYLHLTWHFHIKMKELSEKIQRIPIEIRRKKFNKCLFISLIVEGLLLVICLGKFFLRMYFNKFLINYGSKFLRPNNTGNILYRI